MANGTISGGSNIKFLLGSQDSLENYITKSNGAVAENGAFYLTNDTHRLYVGTSDGHAVPVNEGVISVDRVSALPTNAHPGEFYYAKAENILCVYAGPKTTDGKGGWVQINSNTDTFLVDAISTVKLDGTNVATFTQDFYQNDNTMPFSDNFEIEVADGVKIEVVTDGKNNSIPRIKLTGALIQKFEAAVSNGTATVTLSDTFGTTADFKVTSQDANLHVKKGSGANEIDLSVNDMYNSGLEVVAYDTTNTNTNPTKKTGFSFGVIDGKGGVYADFNPAIKVGKDKPETIVFDKGVANLPVYTQTEIDDIKKALNSMTYMGLVNSNGGSGAAKWSDIYTSNTVRVGDTYMFSAATMHYPNGSSTGVEVSKGTLVIARGTEDPTTGYITGTIQWDFVESTVDTDTKYVLTSVPTTDAGPGSIQLTGQTGGGYEYGEKVSFVDGVAISAQVKVDENKDVTVTFNHDTVTVSRPTEKTIAQEVARYSESNDNAITITPDITVVESVEVNAQGHVTKIQTNKIKLKDTNATIGKMGLTVKGINTVANTSSLATLTNMLQLVDGTGQLMTARTNDWSLKSQTLTFSGDADSSELSVDLVWGSF